MPSLAISHDAAADLDEIWFGIARSDVAAADRLIDSIRDDCKRLARHPYLGRLRPEIRQNLRSWAHGNYIIFYTGSDTVIEIVRVLHGARDLPSLFK